MDISFFGDFLLEKGLIDINQLNIAVDYQLKQNISIGQIALEEKLLNKKQIDKIKKIQRADDKKFGEIAIANKFLTNAQLDVILNKQKETNIFFGKALASLGFLSKKIINKQIEEFEIFQKNKIKHIYTELAFCDKNNILYDSVLIFKTLFYRTFQEHIKFKKVDLKKKIKDNEAILYQKLSGDVILEYILVFPKDLSKLEIKTILADTTKRIASKLSHKNLVLKNKKIKDINKNKFDLEDFDQMSFITTLGDVKLYIKV